MEMAKFSSTEDQMLELKLNPLRLSTNLLKFSF